MRAAYISQNGELDCIQVGEVPDPEPAHDEVVIAVRAAALNHLDIWVRKGRPGLELCFPHVLGSDAAGTVVAKGRQVDSVHIGDEVVLNPGLSCGVCEYCLRGEHSECLYYGIIGMNRPGTFAERIAVPAVNVQPAPPHLSYTEAAALPLAYLTAWRMLMSRGNLKGGETVLIHGIGGGVAIAGLQLARLAGAEVIVTSSSEEKLARARGLGASEAINYGTNPDVAAAVKDLTGGRGVDLILDSVGAATWPINFGAIRRGGRIVHCGVTTGARTQADISALYWNHVSVIGSTMGSREEFRQMVRAVGIARLKPVIDSVLPLVDAANAVGRMERGEQFGKIVLDIKGAFTESVAA
ncbi:MAG: zinc-binding dehydrogenase [Candidatus Hydrogenedentes bacterium]|nr:zinc-binding dehydrogenase [Candidatus Hydrogenedentota bacterium]